MVDITKHAGGKMDGAPTCIVATLVMHGLCGFFFQSAHKDNKPADISDYANPTLAEFQAIYNHTYEAYLVVSMLLSLDISIYGKLIKYFLTSYSMRT